MSIQTEFRFALDVNFPFSNRSPLVTGTVLFLSDCEYEYRLNGSVRVGKVDVRIYKLVIGRKL